ncbi:hypothetical protein AVEN_198206-1 [Araneus ventricosus]|uniref:Integrase zinc-binding domain-containing protein n=1 Tax=Araneus ventricosus TaxID=182803 RepID=A0A4Y2E866_ARAVE|nr:hypothetical protein AVEN_198206-1 [Araneus ventricosus]
MRRVLQQNDIGSCRWQLILRETEFRGSARLILDSASGGHFGVMKTEQNRERFYWNQLRADVKYGAEVPRLQTPKQEPKGRLQL